MIKIEIGAEFRKKAASLAPRPKSLLRDAIQELRKNPKAGKELQEELVGYRSLATARYRLIYRIESNEVIFLVLFAHRKTVYEQLEQ